VAHLRSRFSNGSYHQASDGQFSTGFDHAIGADLVFEPSREIAQSLLD